MYALPYSAMTVDEIQALPVQELALPAAWLFLWATNRYLPAALGLLEGWGFGYRQMIVWDKRGASPFGGTLTHNSAEYLLCAARGRPPVQARWPGGSVLTGSRPGAGKHSTKPSAFLDMVEHCCGGPYVELFARAPRLGWDSWGLGYEGHA